MYIGKMETKNISSRMIVTLILVVGLFILRIPILTGLLVLDSSSSTWVIPFFNIGTYLLIAVLIWWERNQLADYHIDILALLFIIGKPLELLLYKLNLPFSFPPMSIAYYLYIPISLGLLISLLITRPIINKITFRIVYWILIGILVGILFGVYGGIITRIFYNKGIADHLSINILLFYPIQQMLYAGVIEEPFFRGFLWGVLRKFGIKDFWILIIQAVLFWIGHLFHLVNGATFSFWLFIPIGSLLLGILAWRSKSITVSILAHGFSNSYLQIIAFYYLI
jgi:membrane protease YdiL (CAAX protease family)